MKRKAKATAPPTPHVIWDGPVAVALMLVDGLLTRIKQNKVKTFDAANIEQLRRLDAKELKALNVHCERTHEDMKLALKGDSFYIEAYSNYTKAQMKVVIDYLKHIKALKPDAKATGRKLRVVTRKKKQKTPEQLVVKVLFLEKDKETGITSLPPTELVGAKEMWVYNTKTRKFGCYYAKRESGLSVKGTTILDYDTERSMTKMIRKPKEQMTKAMSGNIDTFWNAIRAVPQAISPRLNRDTLILKVKP